MGSIVDLLAKILGFDVGDEPVPRDIISGDESAEADTDLGVIDEVEDTSEEPQPEEPVEVSSVLSQDRQDRIQDLLRQLERRRR